MSPETQRKYVSPQEFSAISGLSLATVYRRLRDGSLPSIQLGPKKSRVLISLDAAERLVSAAPNAGDPSLPPSDEAPKPISGPRPKWMT